MSLESVASWTSSSSCWVGCSGVDTSRAVVGARGGSTGFATGVGSAISIGSIVFVSCIDMTIFCKSMGVMCFSRPLLRLTTDSSLRTCGRARGMDGDDVSVCSRSSDEAESRLEDNSGTGMSFVAAFGVCEQRGLWVGRGCDGD